MDPEYWPFIGGLIRANLVSSSSDTIGGPKIGMFNVCNVCLIFKYLKYVFTDTLIQRYDLIIQFKPGLNAFNVFLMSNIQPHLPV